MSSALDYQRRGRTPVIKPFPVRGNSQYEPLPSPGYFNEYHVESVTPEILPVDYFWSDSLFTPGAVPSLESVPMIEPPPYNLWNYTTQTTTATTSHWIRPVSADTPQYIDSSHVKPVAKRNSQVDSSDVAAAVSSLDLSKEPDHMLVNSTTSSQVPNTATVLESPSVVEQSAPASARLVGFIKVTAVEIDRETDVVKEGPGKERSV
ncbi:hypothetical protein FPQ18DRAFT_309358 [Pyronema domesticum]|nr:hypothetical protein FPQ18DRAFT_309358 [Pyronema domesticum]